jgi:hypothetical protein
MRSLVIFRLLVDDALGWARFVVLRNPGGFEMLLDGPNEPDASNPLTLAVFS